MTRLLIAASAALLLACGAPSTPVESPPTQQAPTLSSTDDAPTHSATPRGRAPTARERAAIQRLEREASRLRELGFARPVDSRIHTQDDIRDFLRDGMNPEELAQSVRVYRALHLLPADTDVAVLIERVLSEQVVGYYDPATHQLVIRDDAARSLATPTIGRAGMNQGQLTLLHELIHALQDQQLNLDLLEEEGVAEDRALAFRSLVEGDATLAMVGHAVQSQGGTLEMITANVENIRRMIGSSMTQLPGQELRNAPPILRMSLVAPYLYGLIFAASLHRAGGWAQINEAFSQPPDSMEQVMHPERYMNRDRPQLLAPPEVPQLAAAGYEEIDAETLGELEMGVYFGLPLEQDLHEGAAAGWDGDALLLYQHAEHPDLALWWSVWDNEAEAREAEAAARQVGDWLPERERAQHLVIRSGTRLLIAHQLPADLHAPLGDAIDALVPENAP